MALQDLGKLVKQKYPGSYDNLSDEELGQNVYAKYPEYKSVVESNNQTQQQVEQPQQNGGFVNELLAPFKQINKSYSTPKQKITSALIGTAIPLPGAGALFNAPKGETLKTAGALGEVASYGLPVGKGLAGLIKMGATAGGLMGSSGAVRSGSTDIGEIAKQGATGTVAGGVLSPIMNKLGKIADNTLIGTAENIYQRLVKTPVAQIRAGKENIASGLLKRNVIGDADQMFSQVKNSVDKSKKVLNKVIDKNKDKKVSLVPVVDELNNLKKQLKATPGESTAAVSSIIKKLKKTGEITLDKAQILKQNLQKAVNDAFLKGNTTGITQAQKIASQKLRTEIEKVAPDVIPHNKELEFGVRAMKRLKETANLSPSKLRSTTELLIGGYGLLANPLITGAVIGERVLTDPKVASRIAQGTYKIGKSETSAKINDLLSKLGVLGVTSQGQNQK